MITASPRRNTWRDGEEANLDLHVDNSYLSTHQIGYDAETGSYWHRVSSTNKQNFTWPKELDTWLKK